MKFLNQTKLNYKSIKHKVEAAVKEQLKGKYNLGEVLKLSIPIKDLYVNKASRKPEIHFTKIAMAKMKSLVAESDIEVAWHGVVTKVGSRYTITDILVYPQSATSVTVESDDDKYPMWMMSIDDDVHSKLRMQGHSHVNMGVNPSGVDYEFMDELGSMVSDFYIFIILNKKHKMFIELWDKQSHIIYESSDLLLTYENDPHELWAAEMLDTYITPIRRIPYDKYK